MTQAEAAAAALEESNSLLQVKIEALINEVARNEAELEALGKLNELKRQGIPKILQSSNRNLKRFLRWEMEKIRGTTKYLRDKCRRDLYQLSL